MQPYKIEFYIYANTPDEVAQAKAKARDFVVTQFKRGRVVTARKFAEALDKAQNNTLISNYLTEMPL